MNIFLKFLGVIGVLAFITWATKAYKKSEKEIEDNTNAKLEILEDLKSRCTIMSEETEAALEKRKDAQAIFEETMRGFGSPNLRVLRDEDAV
jgi:hypothetical protein